MRKYISFLRELYKILRRLDVSLKLLNYGENWVEFEYLEGRVPN